MEDLSLDHEENEKNGIDPWDPSAPISDLFEQVEEAVRVAENAKRP